MSSEEFTNEFINSIRDGKADAFRKRYRDMDTLHTCTCELRPLALARELRGRRAAPGLEGRVVDAAIGAHCAATPPVAGRRPRSPGHAVYTAAGHPPLATGKFRPEPGQEVVPQLSVRERAVATSLSL